MAEAITLVKIFLFLGVIFVVTGLVIPGSDASWNQTRDRFAGEGFPTFQNPFEGETFASNYSIIADGSVKPASATDNDAIPACTTSAAPTANWWGCVIQRDANVSYLTASNVKQARVNMSNLNAATTFSVLAIQITMQCRGNGGDRTVDFLFRKSDDTTLVGEFPSQVVTCHAGPSYENVTATQQLDTAYPIIGDFNHGTVQFNPSGSTDFSYLLIRLIVNGQADCVSGNTLAYVGCAISGFFNFAVKTARFIVNTIIFVLGIITYVLSTAITIFSGIVSTLGFLITTLAAVPVLGPVLILVIIGCVIWFLYTFIRIAAMAVGAIQPV